MKTTNSYPDLFYFSRIHSVIAQFPSGRLFNSVPGFSCSLSDIMKMPSADFIKMELMIKTLFYSKIQLANENYSLKRIMCYRHLAYRLLRLYKNK